MSNGDLRQRTARGTFWATVEVWGVELLQFLVFAILARLLGPAAYGMLGLAIMPVLVVNVFLMQGGWIEFVVRNRDLDPSQVDSIFWTVVALGVALAAAIVALAPFIGRAFGEPGLAELVAVLALCPVLMSLSVIPAALLQREINMAPFAIRSTLSVTVAGAIGIAMALKGFGVWSLVAYEIARPLVAAVVLWGALEWRPQARLAVTHVAEAVRFCSRVLGERLIALTETLVPRAAIGVASSADAVGQWTLARKIFDLSTELVQRPALRVALPRFAGVQQQPGQLSRLLTSAVELTALVAIPGYAILGVLGADLVALSFGESWRTGGQVLMILALLGLITPVTQLSVAVLHAVGRVKLTLKLAVASFAVLVLLVIPGLRWGVFGVAVAFLVRGWAMLFVRLWAIRRTTGVKLSTSGGGFWPLLAAGLAMALVLFLAHTLLVSRLHPLAAMLAALALGVATYSLLLLLLARNRIAAAIALVRDAVRPSAKAEH